MAATPAEVVPRRVLLVDADTNQRRALAIGLRVHGHQADEFGAAAECLAHPALRDADLIVVARFLPDMAGAELARRLNRRVPRARIALVDSDGSEAARNQPIAVGASSTAIITRPLRTEDLLSVLALVPDDAE